MTPAKTPTKNAARSAKRKETVSINVSLPFALHRQLRVKAIENDLDLAAAISAAVAVWIKAK